MKQVLTAIALVVTSSATHALTFSEGADLSDSCGFSECINAGVLDAGLNRISGWLSENDSRDRVIFSVRPGYQVTDAVLHVSFTSSEWSYVEFVFYAQTAEGLYPISGFWSLQPGLNIIDPRMSLGQTHDPFLAGTYVLESFVQGSDYMNQHITSWDYQFNVTQVPEPSTTTLFSLGFLSAALIATRASRLPRKSSVKNSFDT